MSQLNDLAEQLQAIALQQGLTIDQVKNATLQNVEALLGKSLPISGGKLKKVKRIVAAALRDRDDQAAKEAVKAQLVGEARTWLMENFPDTEFDLSRKNGKLCIELWPHGKPLGGDY